MKVNSKSYEIVQFIVANPLLSRAEIAAHFGVSRQRIEQIYSKGLTEAQKVVRDQAIVQSEIDQVLPLVKEETPKNIIAALTGMTLHKVDKICTHPSIAAVLQEQEDKKMENINNLSADWLAGMTIRDIKEKYGWPWSMETCSGHISTFRKKYPEKFPIRLRNQGSLQSKFEEYGKLKSSGMSNADIAAQLGYKNIASMRGAMGQLNNAHESPTT